MAVAIYDADGTLVCGFNSKSDGAGLKLLNGVGTLMVCFPHGIPVSRGTCRFSISILDEDCLEPFASNENALQLPVRPIRSQSGWAHVERQWLS